MDNLFPNGSSFCLSYLSNPESVKSRLCGGEERDYIPEYHDGVDALDLHEGDEIDFATLLGRRLYVIVDSEPVGIDILSGKYVIILSVFLPIHTTDGVEFLWALRQSWLKWSRDKPIKLIIVPKFKPGHGLDPKVIYEHFVSAFPGCLKFPWGDLEQCDFICKSLKLGPPYSENAAILVVDPCQRVLLTCCYFILKFGYASFPFTRDRFTSLRYSLWALRTTVRPVSLKQLLSSDSLVFNPDQELHPVDVLKSHLVGLYLCCDCGSLKTIIKIWEKCRSMGQDLEIVIVYLPTEDNPERFIKCINNMIGDIGWWICPFDDSVSRKLNELCGGDDYDYPEKLIMIGPHGEYLEPSALHLVQSSFGRGGINAYPFSIEVLVQEETQRLRKMTLRSLLVLSDTTNFVVDDTGRPIPVDDLMGELVLVYLLPNLADYASDCDDEVEEMKRICLEKDRLGFKVIFVLLHSEIEGLPAQWFTQFPIFSCPPNLDLENHISKSIYPRGTWEQDMLVAFGTDGHIVSLGCFYTDVFPTHDNLAQNVEDVYRQCFGIRQSY